MAKCDPFRTELLKAQKIKLMELESTMFTLSSDPLLNDHDKHDFEIMIDALFSAVTALDTIIVKSKEMEKCPN